MWNNYEQVEAIAILTGIVRTKMILIENLTSSHTKNHSQIDHLN